MNLYDNKEDLKTIIINTSEKVGFEKVKGNNITAHLEVK